MVIEYLAHACFLLRSQGGTGILIDPYDPGLGYGPINRTCDLIVISHDHRGHNCIGAVPGRALVHRGSLSRRALSPEIGVRSVLADHGNYGGEDPGKILISLIEMDGIRCCHLSDLGQALASGQVADLGQVDLLFIPVGGHSTLDARGAMEVVSQLNPRLVIPMHYLTAMLDRERYPLAGLEPFLDKKTNVTRLRESTMELSIDTLPEKQEIRVMNFAN